MSVDATEAPNHRPLVAALEQEQPTSHAAFQNRLLDMFTKQLEQMRRDSRADAVRIEAAVNRMSVQFNRSMLAVFVLAGLLVVGMVAAVGGNLWIQATRAGMTAGTGETTHTPETP